MKGCDVLVDRIVEGLEDGTPGAVRVLISEHAPDCVHCREHLGALTVLGEGLDPPLAAAPAGFVARVMAEIRGGEVHRGAYDRLPPLWQIGAAAGLFTALAAVVLAGGPADSFAQTALTGFLERALSFLGGLGAGTRELWDAVVPGKGLPILIGCAVLATGLNIVFAVQATRRAARQDTD